MTSTATHNSSIASMNMKLDESMSEHHWDNKTSAFGGNGSTNNVFDMSFMTVTDQTQFTPPRNSKEKLTVKNNSDKDALLPPLSPVSNASNPDATAAPHSPVKKTTSSTDTQYDNVTYREELGSLVLNANRIIFQPYETTTEPAQKKNSWRWTAIHKQQVSPPRTGKTMLKLVSGESDKKAVTFGLPSRQELSRIRRDVAARLQASHNRFPENYSRQSFTTTTNNNIVSSSGSQGTESTEDESVDLADREVVKEEEEEEVSKPIVVAHVETERESPEEPVFEDEPAPEAEEEVVDVEPEDEKPAEEQLSHEPAEDEEAEPELEAPELEEESQDHEDTHEETPETQETVDEENIEQEQEIPADSEDLVDYVASTVADSFPAIEPTLEGDAMAAATSMMKSTVEQLGADDKEDDEQEDATIPADDKEPTLEEQAEAAVARGIAAAMDQHLEEAGPEPSLLVEMEPEPAAAMEEPAEENQAVVDLEQVYRDLEDKDDDKVAKKEKKNWLESLFGFRLFC